jgi:hypothetical protein
VFAVEHHLAKQWKAYNFIEKNSPETVFDNLGGFYILHGEYVMQDLWSNFMQKIYCGMDKLQLT